MKCTILHYSLKIKEPMLRVNMLIGLLIAIFSCTLFSCTDSSFIEPPLNAKNWSSVSLGRGNSNPTGTVGGTMVIEAIRSDGIPRLYMSISEGFFSSALYEYSYASHQWSRRRIDTNGVDHYSLNTAKCQSDGKQRLYASSENGISEFTHTAAGWQIAEIYHGKGYIVAAGDLRNDGFESLYIQGIGMELGILREIRYAAGKWNSTVIDSGSYIEAAAIGDLRGEGKRNLYIGNGRSEIYEIRLEGNQWKKAKITELYPLGENVVHGGVHLITLPGGQSMMGSASGNNYEIKHHNGSWSAVEFHSGLNIEDVSIGAGHNDRYERLYCSAHFDNLYEFSFENGAWTKTSLFQTGASTSLNAVAVGPARGDGIQRVYVLQFIGGLYEFTYQNN